MSRLEEATQKRNFFKLQVCSRTVKRLTKEITERRNETESLTKAVQKAKEDKADQSIIGRTKDDLNLSARTLKVTIAALGKAAQEAETFAKTNYQSELNQLLSNTQDSSIEPIDEVSKEICNLIQSLNACVEVCPEHAALLQLISRKQETQPSNATPEASMTEKSANGLEEAEKGETNDEVF